MGMISTSIGELGEELIRFPPNYIQPTRARKRTIQTGYLDLLYFEYREDRAYWFGQIGILCVVLSVVMWMSRNYLAIALAVITGLGLITWYINQKKYRQFSRYRKRIQDELRSLGVGISHQQLNDSTLGNTGWGQLTGYATSDLGVVKPVSTKGFVDPLQNLFDIFNDGIYR